jgi:hypothetical protein
MDHETIFWWMSHRLRLAGHITRQEIEETFGRSTRQMYTWINRYRSWARSKNEPGLSASQPRADSYTALPRTISLEQVDPEASPGEDDVSRIPAIMDRRNLTTNQALALLDTLRGHCLVATHDAYLPGINSFYPAKRTSEHTIVVEVGNLLHPRLDGPDVNEIILAVQSQKRLSFSYTNKSGTRTDRDVSPHRLIFSMGVYHLRGYCHTTERMLDFNLARMLGARTNEERYLPHSIDHEWKTEASIYFAPNPALSAIQRDVLRQTYPLDQKGVLAVTTLQPLIYYMTQEILGRTFLSDVDKTVRIPCFVQLPAAYPQ